MNQQESQMSDKTRKQKKGTISEEDVSTILQRYSPTTILALLQEVAQVEDANIDWNGLVKRTTTGIKNPREYQMLWRHLAYRDELLEKVEDEAKPLDDDSDLEYELEAFPAVSNEAQTEAAACVKVLIASGSTSDSGLEKGLTIEAPLTINIPTTNSLENVRGTNITVPVFVQKQPLPTVASTEGTDTNNGSGSGNLPPRRKRKPWTAAEDRELHAAVQKCGEGNWANILKGDFKGDRTASQLSQRWNIIKKRNGNANVRSGTGSQLSEVHLAARRALNMALDQPIADNLKASSSLGRTKSVMNSNTSSMRPVVADTPSTSTLVQDNACEDSIKKTLVRPITSPPKCVDAVKATAVAAGARIATQSAAAAILKQQLKGAAAIHIRPSGGPTFRDLHSPLVSRPLANVSSTAMETSVATSPNSPKRIQEVEQVGENVSLAGGDKEASVGEKEVKQGGVECRIGGDSQPVAMEICENQSVKTEK